MFLRRLCNSRENTPGINDKTCKADQVTLQKHTVTRVTNGYLSLIKEKKSAVQLLDGDEPVPGDTQLRFLNHFRSDLVVLWASVDHDDKENL